jgi:hypothetical protein
MLAADRTLARRTPAFSSAFFYYEKNAVFIVFYNDLIHAENFVSAYETRQNHQKHLIDFGRKHRKLNSRFVVVLFIFADIMQTGQGTSAKFVKEFYKKLNMNIETVTKKFSCM